MFLTRLIITASIDLLSVEQFLGTRLWGKAKFQALFAICPSWFSDLRVPIWTPHGFDLGYQNA